MLCLAFLSRNFSRPQFSCTNLVSLSFQFWPIILYFASSCCQFHALWFSRSTALPQTTSNPIFSITMWDNLRHYISKYNCNFSSSYCLKNAEKYEDVIEPTWNIIASLAEINNCIPLAASTHRLEFQLRRGMRQSWGATNSISTCFLKIQQIKMDSQ